MLDNFSGITSPVCGIRWWGVELDLELFTECTKLLPFNIRIYADDQGAPGTLLFEQSVMAQTSSTGVEYTYFELTFELVQYEVTLDPCYLPDGQGWLMISAPEDPQQPTCLFFWVTSEEGDGLSYIDEGGQYAPWPNDLAFCLVTGEVTPTPSPTATVTATPTATPTPTGTEVPSATPTPTPPATPTPSTTPSPSATPTATSTPAASPTPTATTAPRIAIEIDMSCTSDPAELYGDPVEYRITITNTGESKIVKLPLVDRFDPTYLSFLDADPPETTSEGDLRWDELTDQVGDLVPGASVTVDVRFKLVAFESPPGTAAWNEAMVTIAEDEFGQYTEAEGQSGCVTNPQCTDLYADLSQMPLPPPFKEGTAPDKYIYLISVPIYNRGPFPVTHAAVYFYYDSTPDDPEHRTWVLIGTVTTGPLMVGDHEWVELEWDVTNLPDQSVPLYIEPVAEKRPGWECLFEEQVYDIWVPVTLARFEAQGADGEVRLSWRTETEVNNLGFRIERNTDYSGRFEPIHEGLIPGAPGRSFQPREYSFVDHGVENDRVYFYRLAMVDNDGSVRYSPITAAVPQKSPLQLELLTRPDRWVYAPDQPVSLLAKLSNPGKELRLDYWMFLLIDGAYAGTLRNGVEITIPAGFSGQGVIFSYNWTGCEPAGEYTIFVALTDPETQALRLVELSEFRFLGAP
jgi:hypothetical protein